MEKIPCTIYTYRSVRQTSDTLECLTCLYLPPSLVPAVGDCFEFHQPKLLTKITNKLYRLTDDNKDIAEIGIFVEVI